MRSHDVKRLLRGYLTDAHYESVVDFLNEQETLLRDQVEYGETLRGRAARPQRLVPGVHKQVTSLVAELEQAVAAHAEPWVLLHCTANR